ncbi:hypothetical protein, partial [Kitasatospora aureofaciens]|uniref:hypothetical protein n=1 Tax=Kitasatospora aureofaciens TaxID=1894 RepID=UPI001E3EFF08
PRPAPPGRRAPSAASPPRPHRSRYACDTCSVAWSGPEADCWSCGRPASQARDDSSLLHRLLLAPVTPRKAGPR